MPMVNNSQARIEMSAAQVLAFVEAMTETGEGGRELPPMIWIEETNMGSTVAVGGKGMPWTMITHQGEVHEIKDSAR